MKSILSKEVFEDKYTWVAFVWDLCGIQTDIWNTKIAFKIDIFLSNDVENEHEIRLQDHFRA